MLEFLKIMLEGKRDEKGATAVEYGLMVALIAVAIVVTVAALGGKLNALFASSPTAQHRPSDPPSRRARPGPFRSRPRWHPVTLMPGHTAGGIVPVEPQHTEHDERGATAVEYGLMIALIAIAIVISVAAFGNTLSASFQDSCNQLFGELLTPPHEAAAPPPPAAQRWDGCRTRTATKQADSGPPDDRTARARCKAMNASGSRAPTRPHGRVLASRPRHHCPGGRRPPPPASSATT